MKNRLALLAAFSLLSAAPARTQGLVYTFPELEDACTALGDLDGDGHPELVVAKAGTELDAGRVSVRSGRTGAELYGIDGLVSGTGFALALARLDDLDGDGHDDLAIASPLQSAPMVSLRSGLTGAVIGVVFPSVVGEFGRVLASGGDVDGDGVDDLLIASPSPWGGGPGGYVEVVSPMTGVSLRVHISGQAEALAFLGDVDGDGMDDYAVGAPDTASAAVGMVHVFSGGSGGLLYSHSGVSNYHQFGAALAGIGDVDGDGAGDLLVGAPGEQVAPYTTGAAYLYSGASGALIRHQVAPGIGQVMFGKSLAGAGDYDGDGVSDLAVMHSSSWVGGVVKNVGNVYVFSGATGAELERMSTWGQRGPMVNAGDVNLDGIEDLLLASPATAPGLSSILMLGAAPLPAFYCQRSGTCLAQMIWPQSSSLSIGEEPTVRAQDLMGQSTGILFWGLGEASTPFSGGTLCVAAPQVRTPAVNTGGSPGSCDGTLTYTFTRGYLAAKGLAAGTDLFMQVWVRDAGAAPPDDIGMTGGLRCTLWP